MPGRGISMCKGPGVGRRQVWLEHRETEGESDRKWSPGASGVQGHVGP